MKFFLCIAAVVAVASAAAVGVVPVPAGPASLVDENGNPISIGPAFVDHYPISVGPAIIDSGDIAVGPAIIDFPLPDGGAVSAPVEVSPVAVGPAANPASSPLVQIIVNVNAPAGAGPVVDAAADKPVDIIDMMPVVGGESDKPVDIIDIMPVVDPENIVDPVQVVDLTPSVVVDPVQVVDVAPVIVEPVAVGTPVFPAPAITLPEELN